MHRCHACGHEQERAASGLVECDECSVCGSSDEQAVPEDADG
jgi:ribosomal protein L37AE/L43A